MGTLWQWVFFGLGEPTGDFPSLWAASGSIAVLLAFCVNRGLWKWRSRIGGVLIAECRLQGLAEGSLYLFHGAQLAREIASSTFLWNMMLEAHISHRSVRKLGIFA